MKRTTNIQHANKLFIGIDNGVSGTIATIFNNQVELIQTPVISQKNYTKAKGNINRIDFRALYSWLGDRITDHAPESIFVFIERPMVNPGRFKATVSALRALEATLIIIEDMNLPYQYIDSREWQRNLLPTGLKGIELKHASKEIGIRLFPQFREQITKHKDADGLLIAEYARRYF